MSTRYGLARSTIVSWALIARSLLSSSSSEILDKSTTGLWNQLIADVLTPLNIFECSPINELKNKYPSVHNSPYPHGTALIYLFFYLGMSTKKE